VEPAAPLELGHDAPHRLVHRGPNSPQVLALGQGWANSGLTQNGARTVEAVPSNAVPAFAILSSQTKTIPNRQDRGGD